MSERLTTADVLIRMYDELNEGLIPHELVDQLMVIACRTLCEDTEITVRNDKSEDKA